MAGRPGPATIFAKWVVIPILVGLVGYYFVGPRIGPTAPKQPKADASTDENVRIGHSATGDSSASEAPTPTEKAGHQKKTSPEPELDISVRSDSAAPPAAASAPADAPTDTGPVRAAVHRKRPKPASKPKPDADDNTPVVNQNDDSGQADQGGSAGSTTAGG